MSDKPYQSDGGIQAFLDNCPDACVPQANPFAEGEEMKTPPLIMAWAKPGVGFGEIVFYYKDNELHCENETMSREFVKERLCKMVDDSKFDFDEE